jgi:hypothetical protein
MSEPSKILLDSPSDLDPTPVITFLAGLDHPFDVLHGPGGDELSPLAVGQYHKEVSSALGIIYHLDLDRPTHREILWTHDPSQAELDGFAAMVEAAAYKRSEKGVIWDQSPE